MTNTIIADELRKQSYRALQLAYMRILQGEQSTADELVRLSGVYASAAGIVDNAVPAPLSETNAPKTAYAPDIATARSQGSATAETLCRRDCVYFSTYTDTCDYTLMEFKPSPSRAACTVYKQRTTPRSWQERSGAGRFASSRDGGDGCGACLWSGRLVGEVFCDYRDSHDGIGRGCSVEDCDKFEPQKVAERGIT